MASHTVTWPGLPGGPITFSFPVHLNIVPAWRTLQRSGIIARPTRRSIQHENGNRRSGARSDSMYLFNGAEGRQASWHASVDHEVGYINLPANEVGWQAGDGSGPGNMSGFAVELCQLPYTISAAAWREARRNAAEMMGRVSARLGAAPPHQQHNTYSSYGKNCPELLRGTAAHWNEYKSDWMFFYNDEKARMAGGSAPGPEAIEIGDTIKALVNLNLRQAASTKAPIILTLEKGDNATVNGRFASADGYGWLPVETSAGEGFVAMGDASGPYIEKVAGPVTPAITYVKPRPIPALLATDLQKYDTAEGIVSDENGHNFIFVADVIEFTADTVAGEFAVKNPRAVKAPYKKRDRVIGAWLVENEDQDWFYVLAGADDEWIRVPYANTIRVSDAPLLPGDED